MIQGTREMRKRIVLSLGLLILLVAGTGWVLTRPEAIDTRFTGAYVLEDGTHVYIAPRDAEALRYRMMNGESGALWPTRSLTFEGGPGWAEREPVVNTFTFTVGDDGRVNGFEWQRAGKERRHARKLNLRERIEMFPSGELSLRGKLVLPEGEGPFAAVVLVHGSEDTSAVDTYFMPYMYAAHGSASLVFDKRGTGKSEGEYLQNFHVLSDDVVAAVRWLRTQDSIDPDRIHLAGFSQGGWIAPLAALKDGRIASILVGYGVMVPVTGEDRWGYVNALERKGFGEEAIAAADRINVVIEDIVDRGIDRWSELDAMLDAARSEPWFEAVRGSDSILGYVTDTKLPLWALRVLRWWRFEAQAGPPFIDRLYDPMDTMRQLDVPSCWLLADRDVSAPTEWTVAALDQLRAEGKPVEYHVFPNTDHGILTFVEDEHGVRRMLGHAPDYFERQIAWLEAQSAPDIL
jgi:pimeloyl-ACP methyl ester carboxylesterase